MNFDFNNFKKVLYEEARTMFSQIVHELSHEHIYSLALYTSGESLSYIFPTVSTKTGLSEVIEQYAANDLYMDMSVKELEKILKWSPCDSPRHENYVDTLAETEELLAVIREIMSSIDEDDDGGNEYRDFHKKIESICMDVLIELDKKGVFKLLERSSFVLNLLQGDQSDKERLQRAQILNPEDVYIQFKSDLS